MRRSVKTAVVLAAVTLATPAVAQDMNKGSTNKGMSKVPTGGASTEAYKASMDKMMSDMDTKPTGNPDRDFVLMMMPHHQGAIDMAKVELRYGKDPVLRAMAEDIVKAQEKEIGEMKSWQVRNAR